MSEEVEPRPRASDAEPRASAPGVSSPLTDKYVAVTLQHVPVAQRAAAEPPLRSAIAEEIEHRHRRLYGDENITRDDIEVDVLEEMGDPERVAAAMVERPLYLIGPQHFLGYKKLLIWVLAIVTPVVAALAMVSSAEQQAGMASMLLSGLSAGVTAALYAGALTTLGFAVAERMGRPRSGQASVAWTIDKLPEPRRTTISVGETAIAVVSALLVASMIVWQQLSPSVYTAQGEPVPFLNPDYWPLLWSGIVALLLIESLAAIARHVRGQWTFLSASVNLAILTAISGLAVWLLLDHSFLNDAFFDEVGWPTDELPTATLENWSAAVVALVWLTDVAAGFVRAWRSRARGTN